MLLLLTKRKMNKSAVIKVINIKKNFKLGKVKVEVLRGVSFEIYSTEFAVLFGPSGAGKTTVIDLIAGLERPDSGKIKVRDMDIKELDDQRLAEYRNDRIGLVFQEFNLIPNMTALENVSLPLVFDNIPKRRRGPRAKKILHGLGLGKRIDHKPYELSGGEQQRVAVARALINNPWILLVDEPTGDLDSRNALEIMELLAHLNRDLKRTILLVTHNPDYLHYADRVLEIKDGVIVRER